VTGLSLEVILVELTQVESSKFRVADVADHRWSHSFKTIDSFGALKKTAS
jgi:hypothetical protein